MSYSVISASNAAANLIFLYGYNELSVIRVSDNLINYESNDGAVKAVLRVRQKPSDDGKFLETLYCFAYVNTNSETECFYIPTINFTEEDDDTLNLLYNTTL